MKPRRSLVPPTLDFPSLGTRSAGARVPPGEQAHRYERLLQAYDQHAPILKALLIRILGDEERAEPALLSLFLGLWRQPATLCEDEDPLTTLVEKAREQALQGLRNTRTGRATDSRGLLCSGDAKQPESPLCQLVPGQRFLVEGIFFDGKSISALAGEMNVDRDWVKTSVDRGLETLMRSTQVRSPGKPSRRLVLASEEFQTLKPKLKARKGTLSNDSR